MPKSKRPLVVPGSSPSFSIPGYNITYEGASGFGYRLVRNVPIFTIDPKEKRRFSDGIVSRNAEDGGTEASYELGCYISLVQAADRVMLNSRNVVLLTIRQGASHKTTLEEVVHVIEEFVQKHPSTNP